LVNLIKVYKNHKARSFEIKTNIFSGLVEQWMFLNFSEIFNLKRDKLGMLFYNLIDFYRKVAHSDIFWSKIEKWPNTSCEKQEAAATV